MGKKSECASVEKLRMLENIQRELNEHLTQDELVMIALVYKKVSDRLKEEIQNG